jgi:hypothetical protein
MNYPEIAATIGELRRYVDRDLRKKHPGGAYVRSTIIPRATAAEQRKAEKIADPDKTRSFRSEWIPLKHIVTDQTALTIKSLRYAARTYIKHQREADKLPTLVHIGRCKYVLMGWQPSHDDRPHDRPGAEHPALVIRPRNRKRGLTRRAKHG